jgi:hypothetical protein
MQLDLRAAPEHCFNQGDVVLLVFDVKQGIVHRAPSRLPGQALGKAPDAGGPCFSDGQNRLRQLVRAQAAAEVPPGIDEIDGLAWPQTLNAVGEPRMTSVPSLASAGLVCHDFT